MTTAVAEIPQMLSGGLEGEVRRDAFYLGSDEPLFAWLHHQPHRVAHHGVVVCPPIGFEQLHAHRGLRHLADRMARHQLPTLRFDWHGTGDSTGDDMDPARFDTWLANVRTAIRWMKDHLRCRQVSVVGLRLGATLSALALNEDEVENLILWAPVINGRGFVRELHVIDMMSEDCPRKTGTAGLIEAAGFRLSPETGADLSNCSLFQSKPRCRRILLAHRDDAPPDQRLADHFEKLGIAVEQQTWPGVAQMLVEPHKSEVAKAAIDGIASWLHERVAVEQDTHDDDSDHHPPAMPDHVEMPIAGTIIRETACRISPSPDLFGILSEPRDLSNEDLPTIVLLNAGAAYRIGPGRMNVEMARQFSAQGFRCLRLDLCGLGDSVAGEVGDENNSYAETAFRDIELALQALRDRWGSRRFVLMGLCSGAYAAFQSAAQFQDPSLVEGILINPLTYFWRDGMSLDFSPTRELIREHYYLSSALQPGKWLKLLSGRSHIGIRGALRLIARRLGLSRRQPTETCDSVRKIGPSHPAAEDLNADLKQIVASSRQLSMFFATTDPGYSILTSQAGRQAGQMRRSGRLRVNFIDDADHTFSRHAARQKLIDALSRHLCERYRSTGRSPV